jgi:translocation and assembly module TamA
MMRARRPRPHLVSPLRTLLAVALLLTTPVARADAVAVSIDGIDGVLRENVLANLALYQERERGPSAARIRRLHEQAQDDIRKALEPFGYYRPVIEPQLQHDADGWRAHYRIDAGPPLPVRTRDIRLGGDGADDPLLRDVADEIPLHPGDRLAHAAYESGKGRLQARAIENGYFDFRYTRHEVVVDLVGYHADVHLHADTGRRYRFGSITAEQDLLDSELIARYVRIQEGDPYSTAVLLDVQKALAGSDYFADVDVRADPREARDGAVPVRIKLAPRAQHKYTLGIGYGSDTGPRGKLGWDQRYLNPQGHHTRTELRASDIERSLTAGYFIPIRNPRTDQIGISAGYVDTHTLTAETELQRLAVSRTTARGHLLETLSLTLHDEKFKIGSERGESTLLLPGISWSYLLGDEQIYVSEHGGRVLLDVRGASRELASDADLAQGRLRMKYIQALSHIGRVIGRFDVGGTRINDIANLPASLRFFAGGDQSVRGYRYNTLGPRNTEGQVVGGKHLLVGSLEYEQALNADWAAAVFYDVGNAINEFTDPLARGAGIGVRWRSPIGQIRVDIASALSEPGERWRLHLSVGPDL